MSQSQRTAIDELLRHAPFDIGGDVIEQRPIVEKLMTSVPIPSDITTGSRQLGGVPVVDVSTPDSDPAHVVFYLHGGAYAFGSAATSVGLAGDVARRAKARAISVDYRLAPEHPFPAALDDAVAAYGALIAEGVPADQIAVAGESSGGGLLAATLVALKEAGLPQPSSATIFSPWADLSVSGATMTTKAGVDAALTPAALRTRAADYLAGTAPNAPPASPIFADLTGLATLLIKPGPTKSSSMTRCAWPGEPHNTTFPSSFRSGRQSSTFSRVLQRCSMKAVRRSTPPARSSAATGKTSSYCDERTELRHNAAMMATPKVVLPRGDGRSELPGPRAQQRMTGG